MQILKPDSSSAAMSRECHYAAVDLSRAAQFIKNLLEREKTEWELPTSLLAHPNAFVHY